MRETLTLLGAVVVVGAITGVVVAAIKKSRAPKGKPGEYLYHVAPVGEGNDGALRYLAAIAPNFGDVLSFKTLGRGYTSFDAAKKAALDEIAKAGGTALEYTA